MRVQIVFVRSSISWVMTAGMHRYLQLPSLFGLAANRGLLLVRGVTGGTAMILYYTSITLLPLGDAVTIFFSNASALSIASYLFGYEPFSWLVAAGCTSSLGAPSLLACNVK